MEEQIQDFNPEKTSRKTSDDEHDMNMEYIMKRSVWFDCNAGSKKNITKI